MRLPLVLVTGATGKTGSAVVGGLRSRGLPVRALVHTIDHRSDRLARLGAEVVAADIFDPAQVDAALAGVQRLYYLPPWHPHMLHSAVVFATAARKARVEAVVGLSQWLASPAHPSLATRQNWLVQQVFDMAPDAAHVTVNPGFFADNYLGYGLTSLAAQTGIYAVPIRAGRNAPPSNEDIARVVVGVLLDPERHAGRTYRPTGPALLSIEEIADAIATAVERKVRHVRMPMAMFTRALRVTGSRFGVDTYQMSTIRWYYHEHDLGTWEVGGTTTHVRDVAGVEPEAFSTIAARYAATPEAQRSGSNLARALWQLTRIGLTPAPRLDAFVRQQQQPVPPYPQYAGESEWWRAEHVEDAAKACR